MIKSVGIVNFQSHEETAIEFSPGLNVIAGASDAGKSSILRAISWVVKNRPAGDSIRNWSAKKNDSTIVEVVVANQGGEEVVTKERKSNKVSYSTTRGPDPLEAVSRDVPQEVSDILDLSDFNIQSQHEPYFLLNISPGKVAETLNDLVGLTVIDTSFKNLNSDILSLKRAVASEEEKEKGLIEEIGHLSYVQEISTKVYALEKKIDYKASLYETRREITAILQSIFETQSKIEKASVVLGYKSQIASVSSLAEQKEKITGRYQQIKSITEKIEQIYLVLTSEEEWLKIQEPYSQLAQLIKTQKEIHARNLLIKGIAHSISEFQEGIAMLKKDIEGKKNGLELKMKETKICPTCFRPLDKATIERMLS